MLKRHGKYYIDKMYMQTGGYNREGRVKITDLQLDRLAKGDVIELSICPLCQQVNEDLGPYPFNVHMLQKTRVKY
ncbi:hypothetical protein H5410_060595 [Solanum commersonii]|uniref:Uncharacterized protein n=1 Tax=Solanum commersonii TaxID=4109 RepID=A0A9J5W5H6_SOLCO|nr:hypothetical protein H5410_060595 [Solanum commersonii]